MAPARSIFVNWGSFEMNSSPRTSRRLRRLASNWALPVIASLLLIFGVHSLVQADTPPTTNELATYLQTNSLAIGTETVDGYQQIYYNYKGQKVFLTGAPYSHLHPVVSGEFVAWQGQIDGAGQIFIYNVLTGSHTQVTSAGTNQAPSIYKSTVNWESWIDNRWQIFYYDGFQVTQVTADTNPSVRASSDGRQIIYAEQFPTDWQTRSYDITTGLTTTVKQGDEASTAYPKFTSDGTIKTGNLDQ